MPHVQIVQLLAPRGGAAYLYLISILIWPHFDTYPYMSQMLYAGQSDRENVTFFSDF